MTSSRQRRWLVVFLTQDAVAPATEHLAGTTASAFEQRALGFCAPLKPPWSREGGRAEERRMTLSRQPTAAAWASQRRRLGQRPPCPPASSAVTIVGLEPPPSSSIIAVAFSSLGCEATMRTPAGEECGAPALAPASPVKSEPASAAAGGGGTGSLFWLLRGGADDPPSSSCRQPKDLPAAAAAAVAAAPAWWKVGREELSSLSCFSCGWGGGTTIGWMDKSVRQKNPGKTALPKQ